MAVLITSSIHNQQKCFACLDSGFSSISSEEYIFRGVILTSLLDSFENKINRKKIIFAIVISGLLFGTAHFAHIVTQGFLISMVQVIQVSAMGCLLCALYVRTGSILMPMLVHFAIDYFIIVRVGTVQKKMPTDPISLIVEIVFPFTIYLVLAIVVLNPKNPSRWKLVEQLSSKT
ncbi:CPBP family intramembrane glutamic endopeptidase [Companilactobacillus nuruki]|uniref:CPBP family intramembrane glutamic endopeptidase n=1 Tax=Companilactobacillus nuruki TaxID=1993540 RepID=UPI001416F1ED|nr:CPBP family intramembrane glutamic endopeptidase [Companilactobacillus nuruki]